MISLGNKSTEKMDGKEEVWTRNSAFCLLGDELKSRRHALPSLCIFTTLSSGLCNFLRDGDENSVIIFLTLILAV